MGHQVSFHHGEDISNGEGTSDIFTAVVRPMYKWNDTMRTIGEAGYSYGERRSLEPQLRLAVASLL